MRRLITISVVFCLLLSVSVIADEKTECKPNTLTVSGKIKVTAKADKATISFTITGEGKSLEKAFGRVRAKMDSVATRLIAIGIDKNELSTSFFHTGENFGDKAFLSSKRDFKTSTSTTLTTNKLELLEDVIIVLSESKVENISGIKFELDNYEQIRLDALRDATSKAREKAEVMLDVMGSKIVEVLKVSTVTHPKVRNNYPNPFNASVSYGASQPAVSSIFPEVIEFETEVAIRLEIGMKDQPVETPEEG